MPHDLKLEGTPACPQITPVAVPEGQYATVQNVSNRPLHYLPSINGTPETVEIGETAALPTGAYLVATGTTEIKVSFLVLEDPITPEIVASEPPVSAVEDTEPEPEPDLQTAPEADPEVVS